MLLNTLSQNHFSWLHSILIPRYTVAYVISPLPLALKFAAVVISNATLKLYVQFWLLPWGSLLELELMRKGRNFYLNEFLSKLN